MNTSAKLQLKSFDLISAMKEYKIIIALLCILCAVLFCVGARLLVPSEYQSSITLYANTPYGTAGADNGEATESDADLANRMIDTYVVILQSRSTLRQVIDRGQLDYSYEELSAEIGTSAVSSTEALKITVTDKDPYKARFIANLIAETLPAQVASIITDTEVKVVDYAEVIKVPNKINYLPWAIAGILAGFVLGCVLSIFVLPYRQKIRNAKSLQGKYLVPVLATIPDLASPINPCDKNMAHPASGTYYVLATNIAGTLKKDNACNVLGITSPDHREGKTTTIANLCYTLAHIGNSVLTIEGELDNAGLSKQMKLDPSPGIAGIIKKGSNTKIKDFIINSGIHDNWDILPAGEGCGDKLGFFRNNYIENLLSEADFIYDYVIIDLPPAATEDGKDIAIAFDKCRDGVLLVIREKQTTCRNLEKALDTINDSDAEFKGTILTKA